MDQPKHLREPWEVERRCAIERGLEFVYLTACDPENFEDYGFDYLFSFYWLYSTSKDRSLRNMAFRMGRERAALWRHSHPALPAEIDADTITQFVFATDAADRIGLRDTAMKAQIRRRAKRFGARDYFWFDPTTEEPPNDVPESCSCGADNSRGRRTCRKCRRPLTMMSRYEVWLVALIRSYIGERYGVTLGARYAHVLQWLPSMRPFGGPQDGPGPDNVWAIYAVTHIVYTLNGYGVYNLLPEWLPNEFEFLSNYVPEAIATDDPETMGEILHSLKSFGLTRKHSLIQNGEEFILSRQNSDGSWGEMEAEDIYERYHPTIAAIDGLRLNAWRGPGLSFPNLKPLLRLWAQLVRPDLATSEPEAL